MRASDNRPREDEPTAGAAAVNGSTEPTGREVVGLKEYASTRLPLLVARQLLVPAPSGTAPAEVVEGWALMVRFRVRAAVLGGD